MQKDVKCVTAGTKSVQSLHQTVEPLSDEHERKIEIIASKTIKKDCNQVRLLGSITQHTLSGWGYPYFQINTPKDAPYASTMMACPTQPEPTETNVSLTSQHLYRYNSKLPIVVYAPQSLHVNIRVWKPI